MDVLLELLYEFEYLYSSIAAFVVDHVDWEATTASASGDKSKPASSDSYSSIERGESVRIVSLSSSSESETQRH